MSNILKVTVTEADYGGFNDHTTVYFVETVIPASDAQASLDNAFVRLNGNIGHTTKRGDIRSITVSKVEPMTFVDCVKAINDL